MSANTMDVHAAAAAACDVPYITRDERRRCWVLERECRVASRGYVIVIPGGFTFDLASVPRLLWNLCAPFELSISGPLVHDFLYEHGGRAQTLVNGWPATAVFTRKDADDFLLDLMRQGDVPRLRRWVAYHAVRLFGGAAWQPDGLG